MKKPNTILVILLAFIFVSLFITKRKIYENFVASNHPELDAECALWTFASQSTPDIVNTDDWKELQSQGVALDPNTAGNDLCLKNYAVDGVPCCVRGQGLRVYTGCKGNNPSNPAECIRKLKDMNNSAELKLIFNKTDSEKKKYLFSTTPPTPEMKESYFKAMNTSIAGLHKYIHNYNKQ